jgi:hypothetical protein
MNTNNQTNTNPVKAPTVPLSVALATNPTVAKSIARPDAFAKPGTMGKAAAVKSQGMRFRPLQYKRGPGRPRKNPRDVRSIIYY